MPRIPARDRLAEIATVATEHFGRLGAFLYWFEMSSERLPVLPVATPGEGETLAVIEAGLRRIEMPRIRAALLDDEPVDVAGELAEIIEERYALLEHYWPLLAVIERCTVEMPALEAAWFGLARAGTYEELGRYLKRRMAAGLLRPMTDSEVAARLVTESLAWFAWYRREGRDANLYDDAAGKRTVVEFICAALVPQAAGETPARSPAP